MTEEFAGYWEDFEVGKTYPTTTRKITEQDHAEFCRVVGYDEIGRASCRERVCAIV